MNVLEGGLAGLESQISKLKRQIAADEDDIATREDRISVPFNGPIFDRTPIQAVAEAQKIRDRLADEKSQLKDLEAARDSLLTADFKRKEAEERKAKWKQVQAECRSLKRELEEAQKAVLSLKAARDFAQKALLDAIAMTDAVIGSPPSLEDYPDDEDYAAHARLLEKSKKEQAAASARFKEADDACLRKMLEERHLFGRMAVAAQVEINLRPPDATR
jgi:hypothetical protein